MSSPTVRELPTHHFARFMRAMLAMRRRPLDPVWARSSSGHRAGAGPRGPGRIDLRGPCWLPLWTGTEPGHIRHMHTAVDDPDMWGAPRTVVVDGGRLVTYRRFDAARPVVEPRILEELLDPRTSAAHPVVQIDTTGYNPLAVGVRLAAHLDAAKDRGWDREPVAPIAQWVARHHGPRARGEQIRPAEWRLVVFDLAADDDVPLGQAIAGTDPGLLDDIERSYPGALRTPLGAWQPPADPYRAVPAMSATSSPAGPRSLAEAAQALLTRAGLILSKGGAHRHDSGPLVMAMWALLDAVDVSDNSETHTSNPSTVDHDDE